MLHTLCSRIYYAQHANYKYNNYLFEEFFLTYHAIDYDDDMKKIEAFHSRMAAVERIPLFRAMVEAHPDVIPTIARVFYRRHYFAGETIFKKVEHFFCCCQVLFFDLTHQTTNNPVLYTIYTPEPE